jgi:succinate dehydrogenase / fumarate reductase flavoprotein subunit
MVYLDCTHLPDATKEKLAGIFEIYEKFTGDDPRHVAMKIFPAVHYTMGGLYATYTPKEDFKGMQPGAPNNMMTSVPGLYAFGEVNYHYHGGTRLGANALLSCIFDGLFCGPSVVNYAKQAKKPAAELDPGVYDRYLAQERDKAQKLIQGTGEHNPYTLHRQMGDIMTDACTVVRTEEGLREAYTVVERLREQSKSMRLSDTGMWTNQTLSFARALGDMLVYAEAILAGAINRRESRGSHYRSDYPDRNDVDYLKTTVAKYNSAVGRAIIELEDVPQPLIPPRPRTYGKSD